MTERCVDASVAVRWAVKGEPFRGKAHAFLSDAGVNNIRLIAPPNFANEVDSAIPKRVFDGRLSVTEGQKAYAILDAAPVEIVEMPGVRQRAREIAEQFDQRFVYDAVNAGLPFVKYLPDYP